MNRYLKRYLVILLLALIAIALSLIEGYIPMPIPEIKLGLANIVILIMLYEFKPYEAFIVDMLRVLVVALIKGTIATPMLYLSLFGSLAAFLIMLIFTSIKGFSIVLSSILGAVFHMAGQICSLMVIASIENAAVAIPILALIAIANGLIGGILARLYLKNGITSRLIDVNRVEFKER